MARMSLIAPVGWRPNSRASLTTDSLVWADLLGEARVQARTVVRYLVFMIIAGIIAGFGVIDANTILIVGAMALSPDLLPVSAACVGLVTFRLRLAARGHADAGGRAVGGNLCGRACSRVPGRHRSAAVGPFTGADSGSARCRP